MSMTAEELQARSTALLALLECNKKSIFSYETQLAAEQAINRQAVILCEALNSTPAGGFSHGVAKPVTHQYTVPSYPAPRHQL
jgi:hypothetical protein